MFNTIKHYRNTNWNHKMAFGTPSDSDDETFRAFTDTNTLLQQACHGFPPLHYGNSLNKKDRKLWGHHVLIGGGNWIIPDWLSTVLGVDDGVAEQCSPTLDVAGSKAKGFSLDGIKKEGKFGAAHLPAMNCFPRRYPSAMPPCFGSGWL